MAELVKICDPAGRTRGSGFVADDRGTVVTSHEAVDGLTRIVLHAPGPAGRSWLAGAADVTALPGLALALVRTDGLGMRPLPVALREVIDPGTYVRLPARGWRQARVLGGAEVSYRAADRSHAVPAGVAVELAIGTDGRDALLLGGEACGGPVLDAGTGAVLAVVGTALRAEHRSGGFAVALRAAADADPDGPLAALLERNAATVPGHGADLNLAGALELTATTLGASFSPDEPEPVERPGIAAELAAFTTGDRPVLGLVGDPGTGRTTALAALAVRRARGACPAPTLWLRGADLRATDTSLADAATRALTAAARIVDTASAGAGWVPQPPPHGADGSGSAGSGSSPSPGSDGTGCVSGRSPQGAERTAAAHSDPSPRSAPEETPRRAPGPGGTPPDAQPSHPAPGPGAAAPAEGCSRPAPGPGGTVPAERRSRPAGAAAHLAHVVARAGRRLLVVLDAPEEMPPELAHRLGPWTTATAGWLHSTGARLVVAARPEYWEGAGALYPPEALHTPARAARRLPPALPLADLDAAEAETARARLGIPADAVREADARHPLTLHLLAGIRAAEVTAGRPGRDEVFAAHLDLLCLRTAVRIAAACADAGGARVHGPGVRRLAARVAGRVHEAARRVLGPGQGQLDRASFEELFPWRTGWASAVLTEGLLVPAGPGYRFAHEELSDWIQAGHLDVPTALGLLVHGPAEPGLPVPRHRIGPVLEALRRLAPDRLRGELTGLVHRLNRFTEEPERATPDRAWWAARLLRETLLRAPDARPHLPVLHALAEHVARAGPGEFGGWFWSRLRLPEPDRLDLLRRLLPADPAEAVPGDRYLDAAARRLARDPQRAQPLLCAWFSDGRRLRGRPGATVATAAQALLHTHRSLAVDDLTEALVTAAHPRADELLAVLAEEEPSALCRAVDRWAHDERPGRRVAAASYGLATAPHVRTPADRELLRHAAQALLARPADATLHGSALAILLRDPQARGRYLPDALACFRDPGFGSRLPAAALVAALPVLPDPDEVFAALRARADGEVVRALAALTTPGLARRAAELVREHLARSPGDAPHAAFFVDRRLDQGPAAASVVRPLVLDLLFGAPAGVRAELAVVLAAPGGAASYPLRGELADTLLREETDPGVLDAFLGALAAKAAGRAEDRTRELLRRTGRQLLRAPGGAAVFERRTVELARAEPVFGALVARWLATAEAEAAALLGPSARRTVETLSRAAADVT
ncbi:serine protease [Streptomyces xanthophaeus]|uniref:serine protease n=1 Tax=Streptomyces xanthophaeus TaxID=67385 RepID=UPI002649AE94|nr:serine protease [Streptomyces xanthophaeus]WKD32257.1 serine protease [Streptomyces xanthophaeus]